MAIYKNDTLYAPREYQFNIENVSFNLLANIIEPRDKYVKLYSHSFYVLIFVTRGSMKLTVENDEYTLSSGSGMIVSPHIKHMTTFKSNETEANCISFGYIKNTLDDSNDLFGKLDSFLSVRNYPIIGKAIIFELMQKCFNSVLSGNKYVISSAFHELLTGLLIDGGIIKTDEGIDEILPDSNISRLHKINTLANVYYDKNITIEDIAKMLFLSTRQANRIIQIHYGCSWRELVVQKRMLVAIDLLKTTEMTISEIAEYIGYESERGFYSAFKKHFNQPPGFYRNNQ